MKDIIVDKNFLDNINIISNGTLTNDEINELKNELANIMNTRLSVKEKMKKFEPLHEKYKVYIGVGSDNIGMFGVFVSQENQPLFAIATDEFKESLKLREKELEKEINKITKSNDIIRIKKRLKKLEKEYQIKTEYENKKVVVYGGCGSWLFWNRF